MKNENKIYVKTLWSNIELLEMKTYSNLTRDVIISNNFIH